MEYLKNTAIAALLLVILIPWAAPSRAQDVNLARVVPGSQRIHTSFGLDPAVLTTVGYVRGFRLGSRQALWEADLGLAVKAGDAEDLRLRVGLQSTLWQAGSWRLAARGRLIARSTSNSVYDGQGFGADLTANLGLYRQRWFVSGSVGYDRTFAMHIEHSTWYRQNIFADAVDGWYRGQSGILRGGLTAGLAVGVVEVATRVEVRRLDGGEQIDPPFVAELSFSVPF